MGIKRINTIWREYWAITALYTLFIAFIAVPSCLIAQSLHRDILHKGYNIEATLWKDSDGLPSWLIKDILQDSQGFVWLLNNQILTRFDGRQFVSFSLEDLGGRFQSLETFGEDKDGQLWLLGLKGNDYAVEVLDPYTMNCQPLGTYLKMDKDWRYPIWRLGGKLTVNLYRTQKKIYLISRSGEGWRYDGEWKQVLRDRRPKKKNGRSYLPASNVTFLSWSSSGTPYLIDSLGQQLLVLSDMPTMNQYFWLDDNNCVWQCPYNQRPKRLVCQSEGETTVRKPLPDSRSNIGRWGNLWSRSSYAISDFENGLTFSFSSSNYELSLRGQTLIPAFFSFLRTETGLDLRPEKKIVGYQGTDGSIWMPVVGGLLRLKFSKSNFYHLLPGKSVRGIDFLNDQTLIATTYSETFAQSLEGGPPALFPSPVQATYINRARAMKNSVAVKNGRVWFGEPNPYLHEYNQKTRQYFLYPFPEGFSEYKQGRCIAFLSEDEPVICNSDAIFQKLPGRDTLSLLTRVGVQLYWLHSQRKKLWAGTANGLYYLPEDTFYLASPPDKPPLRIEHIHEDELGAFWLSTDQGLIHWIPFSDTFQQFTKADGLSDNTIHAAYPDERGYLWLSTNKGVTAFDKQQYKTLVFSSSEGLPETEINYLAHRRGPDGYLYFGSINGVIAFHPDSLSLEQHFPPHTLRIEQIAIEKRSMGREILGVVPPIVPTDPATLPISTQKLHLTTAIPFFNNQAQLNLRWRIPAQDSSWTESSPYEVMIRNLPYGPFEVELQYFTLQKQADRRLKLYFYRNSPFYRQTWFFIALPLLFTLLFGVLTRWHYSTLRANNRKLKEGIANRTQELLVRNETIRNQKEKLEKIYQQRRQLFANIGHEFRTPLSLILGHSEGLLQESDLPPYQQAIASNIRKHALKLSEMLDEMMDLTQMESDDLPLHETTTEWWAFIRRSYGTFKGAAEYKRLDYQLDIPDEAPLLLSFDLKKTERILNNLISNAIKFTPPQGQVKIQSRKKGEHIQLIVSDDGPGILKDELPHIFDRYYQGNAAQKSAQPGYGIGLALSKEYTNLMGGKLWAESQAGKGSTFYFEIPAKPGEMPALQEADETLLEEEALLATPSSEQKMTGRLLIVEDHEDMREFLALFFQNQYEVVTVKNGEEALQQLNQPQAFDLILSDAMMPGMDGFTLLETLRNHPRFGFIPFILLTALSNTEDKVAALRLGVDSFVTKPFNITELKARVDSLLDLQRERKKTLNRLSLADTGVSATEGDTESYDQIWVNQLQEVMNQKIANSNIKVQDLAREMYMSERSFRDQIKQYTGMTPSKYIMKARMDKALMLLQARKYKTITEVCSAVGLKDTRHFSRVFKHYFGKLPSDYLY